MSNLCMSNLCCFSTAAFDDWRVASSNSNDGRLLSGLLFHCFVPWYPVVPWSQWFSLSWYSILFHHVQCCSRLCSMSIPLVPCSVQHSVRHLLLNDLNPRPEKQLIAAIPATWAVEQNPTNPNKPQRIEPQLGAVKNCAFKFNIAQTWILKAGKQSNPGTLRWRTICSSLTNPLQDPHTQSYTYN